MSVVEGVVKVVGLWWGWCGLVFGLEGVVKFSGYCVGDYVRLLLCGDLVCVVDEGVL